MYRALKLSLTLHLKLKFHFHCLQFSCFHLSLFNLDFSCLQCLHTNWNSTVYMGFNLKNTLSLLLALTFFTLSALPLRLALKLFKVFATPIQHLRCKQVTLEDILRHLSVFVPAILGPPLVFTLNLEQNMQKKRSF